MERKIIVTADGSHTIAIPDMKVTYHSIYGAIAESMHVFIKNGLRHLMLTGRRTSIRVLEMGFGTGLNALLSLREIQDDALTLHYTALELFPLDEEMAGSLNYCEQLGQRDLHPLFQKMHSCPWEAEVPITDRFMLKKVRPTLYSAGGTEKFHLIYYDAFAPAAQPEQWTREVFENLYSLLEPGGVLVTYCSKGEVRRAMLSAGFHVEKLKGAPGKREMLRATK